MDKELLIGGLTAVFIGVVSWFFNIPKIIVAFLVFLGVSLTIISGLEKQKPSKHTKRKKLEHKVEIKEESPLKEKVVRIIKENNGILQTELIDMLDVSRSEIYKLLEELEKEGVIKREKHGRTYKLFIE